MGEFDCGDDTVSENQFHQEVAAGERFEFGKNWQRFLSTLNNEQILAAEKSLKQMLEVNDLRGKRFLDIGCGSGLSSLVARRLGAIVYSFDYDPQSVACTTELKRRYFPDDQDWIVAEGSVLDIGYLRSLGQFDIVYSWGVLHHTGAMWQALENVVLPVAKNGQLFIAIYNDQGSWSVRWLKIKKRYNQLPDPLKAPFAFIIMGSREVKTFMAALLTLKINTYLQDWTQYSRTRGMSRWYDLIDWIGGYPFEVAKPEKIFEFYRDRGFVLYKLKTSGGGLACNEYIFERK